MRTRVGGGARQRKVCTRGGRLGLRAVLLALLLSQYVTAGGAGSATNSGLSLLTSLSSGLYKQTVHTAREQGLYVSFRGLAWPLALQFWP